MKFIHVARAFEAIEKVKLGIACLVILIKRLVRGRTDATYHPAFPDSQKEISLGMGEEGMLPAIEGQVGIHEERRHKLGAIFVQVIVKFDEFLHLCAVRRINLLDG